jgi:hypothetical protein
LSFIIRMRIMMNMRRKSDASGDLGMLLVGADAVL